MSDDALFLAAKAAWTFTLPLMEIASPRTRSFAGGAPMNQLAHGRDLVDHTARAITTPNNDTLYSSAHLDLGKGPVSLELPPSGERYLSLALMDAYSNNFAILGTRTTGENGGRFTLVGPWDAAQGPDLIRAPTPRVWALARILVDGPEDLAAARAVQDGLVVEAPPAPEPVSVADRSAPWSEYFASAARLLAENPPPVTDRAMLETMAPLGIHRFDAGRFSRAQGEVIAAAVEEARREARRSGLKGPTFIGGWAYPYARLGDFGEEYAYRATIALGGLAALPPQEAMYMRCRGHLPGALLDGTRDWRLSFPAGQELPVNSFWSLSLYEATADGQFFFADNPLNRYSIGDRTRGLTRNPDGSLDIWIGHRSPGAGRESNWLPAPAAPFALFMRAYLPKPELLHGAYRLPPVEAIEP